MKRYLFLPILLIVISCTAFNNTVGQVESEEIKKEVTSAIAELKEATDLNKYEKIEEFSELKNYTSLHKALRILDDGHMARLAKKLEVSVDMLNATLAVLNKI